jgi:2-oxoglutarate ferredoxin oxidoreductase subunit beta
VLITLGLGNVSFVARTVDWNPLHLYQTLRTASRHPGLSFVHILQRCPTYTEDLLAEFRNDPDQIQLLVHDEGVPVDAPVAKLYKNQAPHDPTDLEGARRFAEATDRLSIGLFYRNTAAPCYDDYTVRGLGMTQQDKLQGFEQVLDKFAI